MGETFLHFLIFIASTSATLAQPVQVVPGGLANVEGNSRATEPFNSTSFRFQQVFDASQFAFVGGATARIDRISLRIDGASVHDVALSFGGSSVQLSTTLRTPDGLSPIFADNRGSDGVTIWNGGLSLGGVAQPGAMPQNWPFAGLIPVFTPFYYIPSHGNLLLDVAASGGQPFLPGSLDAHSVTGDSMSWVWSADGNSASGTLSTLGLVTRFDITVVPEPSVWLLVGLGLIVMGAVRRRNHYGAR